MLQWHIAFSNFTTQDKFYRKEIGLFWISCSWLIKYQFLLVLVRFMPENTHNLRSFCRQQFEFCLMAVAEEVHAILKALPQWDSDRNNHEKAKEGSDQVEERWKKTFFRWKFFWQDFFSLSNFRFGRNFSGPRLEPSTTPPTQLSPTLFGSEWRRTYPWRKKRRWKKRLFDQPEEEEV